MFESHVIIGHIGDVRNNEEHKLVSISVAVRQGNEPPVWWEIALWNDKQEVLDKLNAEKGSLVAAQVFGVHAYAYLDDEGKPQASLRAAVHMLKILTPKTPDNTRVRRA